MLHLYRLDHAGFSSAGLLSYSQACDLTPDPDIKDRLGNFLTCLHRISHENGLTTPQQHHIWAVMTTNHCFDPRVNQSVSVISGLCWEDNERRGFVLSLLPINGLSDHLLIEDNGFHNPYELQITQRNRSILH